MCEKSVSIIVPLYNKASQIGRCLESLKSQSYDNYKVIVVDDGSTDQSLEIAKQFESDKIKVYHKGNGGVSSARNFGINIADTDYIAFVDSDDWVDEDYVSDFFKLKCDSSSSLVLQGVKKIKHKKCEEICKYDDTIVEKQNFNDAFSKYNLLHNGFPVSKLFNLNLIKTHNIRFIEGLPTHEDHVFVLTYLQYVDKVILSSSANYSYVLDENDSSLSKKLYVPEIYLQASDALLKAMNNLYCSMDISANYYFRARTDYGLNQRIRAILSAYIKGYDKKHRRNLLTNEFHKNRFLYRHYKSKRKIQDLLLKIILNTPVLLLDTILFSVISIMGIKGKEVRLYLK